MVTGSVTVVAGGVLRLHGMIVGDLVVMSGGTALVHGTVAHDVFNRGGEVDVFGTIDGTLHRKGGTTRDDRNASVRVGGSP